MGHQESYRARSRRSGRRGHLHRKRTRPRAHGGQVMVIRTLGCWLLFVLGIFAQSGGTITGTVVDLGGDPVVNAAIQATNTETKAVYKQTTTAGGGYTV